MAIKGTQVDATRIGIGSASANDASSSTPPPPSLKPSSSKKKKAVNAADTKTPIALPVVTSNSPTDNSQASSDTMEATKTSAVTGGLLAISNSPPDQVDGNSSPTVDPPCHTMTIAIKDMSPVIADNWVLHARVIARAPVRKWENLRGGGTLQELFLVDKNGDGIRVTLFNDAVTNFTDATEPGSSCCLSGGKIKFEVTNFKKAKRENQLSFGANADIRSIGGDDLAKVTQNTPFTRFSELTHLPGKALVNVIGILLQVTPTKRVKSAQGKNLQKREFALVDDSEVRVFCTVWGSNARDEFDNFEGDPILVKNGQIDDYMGTRSVSVGIGSSLMVASVLPRANELAEWYALGVDHASFPIAQSP